MPRSPFSGTYQPNLRPTVVMAPDTVVRINGDDGVVSCPSCKKKFNFGKYITGVQVDLSVDSAPGSATINLSIPNHVVDEFLVDGSPIISPMMEIEIFSKGFFLVEGVPQYYPIFWGLVTEVGHDYADGAHTYSLNCADILKWWELCQINVNPAYTSPVGTQLGRSIFGNVLFGKNPYDVIWTLCQQSMGDIIVGTNSLVSVNKEAGNGSLFKNAIADMMLYWEERFSRIRSGLLLYGIQGNFVRGDSLWTQMRSGGAKQGAPFASSAVARANGGDSAKQMVFDPTDPNVTAFRTQFMQAGEINFWQSEYTPKLQIANSCKDAIGFELFMDVDGSIVFKPPFYNLDVLENKPVSWIQEIDIITCNFSESEAEVVTQVQMQGSMYGNVDYGLPEELTPHVSVTDYHLLRKYGWRVHEATSEFLGSPHLMFYHGMDLLDRINARRFRGSVTIPHRPELRLGFPVYIQHLDQYWYVIGISHNVEIGGRATTTLTLTAKRQKFTAPQGIATFRPAKNGYADPNLNPKAAAKINWELKMGSAATFPPDKINITAGQNNPYDPLVLRHPKTGRKLGFPNAVMVHTRPFRPSPENLARVKGENPKAGAQSTAAKAKQKDSIKKANEEARIANQGLTADQISDLKTKVNQNRHAYGLTSSGVYVYAYDTSKAITQFSLINAKNITVTGDSAPKLAESTLLRPVSDERGFEVIGHFRYGRGATLRDGSLVLQDGTSNAQAQVSTPVAISGDLLTSLTAQSQGLTTVNTPFPNPALTLATLTVDDTETAAILTPEGTPQFPSSTGKFLGTASPLGSPEEKGNATLEATQLSKALTLAELSLQGGQTAATTGCSCLLQRPDLNFMNVGYQVKTLNGTLPAGDASQGVVKSDPSAVEFGHIGDSAFFSTPQPVAALTIEEVQAKIDGYLFTLYQALDGPHQLNRKAITGELVEKSIGEQEGIGANLFPDENLPGNGLAPPFSSVNRAALGDPVAIAQQSSTATSDMSRAASSFGANLKKARLKTVYAADIANLQRQRDTLVAQGASPDDIAGVDQQIAAKQLLLAQL